MINNNKKNSFSPRSQYGFKVDRIYRILLSVNEKPKSWYQIAKKANVAYGWAHKILTNLQKDELINGPDVINPRQLFELWSNRLSHILYRGYHVQRPENLIKDSHLNYAITTYYGENLIGDYLFPRFLDIYIHKDDALKWHSLLIENGYVGKGNVRVFLNDDHVFWDNNTIEGWAVVSIQQLIVDLIREGAECLEAANLLIKRFYND